jgi:hypothetical protein
MRLLFIIAFLGLSLTQAASQVFLNSTSQHFIGVGISTESGKPIDIKYSFIRPKGLGSFFIKASRGWHEQTAIYYTNYYGKTIYSFGNLARTKKVDFWYIDPGIYIPIKKKAFRRSFVSLSYPMAFSTITTIDKFSNDAVYQNLQFTHYDNQRYFTGGAKVEYLWQFGFKSKSFFEMGVAFVKPIQKVTLFQYKSNDTPFRSFAPGAGYFPYINLSMAYHFKLQ